MDPISAGLALGGGALSAFTSADAARATNTAVDASQASATSSAQVQADQTAKQAALEKQKRLRDLSSVLGSLRVSAGDSGTGFEGSFAALSRAAQGDTARNFSVIDTNLVSTLKSIQSGLDASYVSLNSRRRNVFLDTATGFLAGGQTGLSLGTHINSAITDYNAAEEAIKKKNEMGVTP